MDVFDIDAESAENRKIGHSFGDEYKDLVLTPYVQTFTEQLHLALDFYEANNVTENPEPIKVIYLTGGGARLSGFVDALGAANVSHNIRLLNLAPYINCQDLSALMTRCSLESIILGNRLGDGRHKLMARKI